MQQFTPQPGRLRPGARRIRWLAATAALLLAAASPGATQPVADWSREVLYFVLVDRFADGDGTNNDRVERRNPGGYHGGDLKGLAAQLGELSDLGVTALWINPVQKQMDRPVPAQAPARLGLGSFDHWGFHGYWISDFGAIEPQFGTAADLKLLVDEAHRRGIKVLLDVVYNHTAYSSPYVGRTTASGERWTRVGEGNCDVDPVRCAVGGLPDFKTELPEVRDHLLDANLGLARRAGVDGFRLDTYKHLDTAFWLEHRRRTRAELRPDFFLLAEQWGANAASMDPHFARDEVDSAFDFGFKGSCEGFVLGRGRAVAYGAYLRSRHKVRPGYLMAHYLSSHDEPMALANLGGDRERFRLCVAVQMTSLGLPVIYYGEEVARGGSEWPLNRNDMPWGERPIRPGGGVARDEALRAYYQALIRIRREHPALTRGDFTLLSGPQDPLLAFARADAASGDHVVVLVNRDDQGAQADYPLPPGWPAGAAARDALTGDAATLAEGRLRIALRPKSARVIVAAPAPGS